MHGTTRRELYESTDRETSTVTRGREQTGLGNDRALRRSKMETPRRPTSSWRGVHRNPSLGTGRTLPNVSPTLKHSLQCPRTDHSFVPLGHSPCFFIVCPEFHSHVVCTPTMQVTLVGFVGLELYMFVVEYFTPEPDPF